MSDLKLFRATSAAVVELASATVALEKSLQNLFEKFLEPLLGVRFLASEYMTNEGGRMDTVGLDENSSPVIIEYKRATNENVINQGLFYLNWLVGHKKDFEWLVFERFGEKAAKSVDWSGPRLICVAGDFTKYDEHAVRQMDRNIALIRYRRYEHDLLLLEQLTATTSKSLMVDNAGVISKNKYKTVSMSLASASQPLADLYHMVEAYLLAMGDDVATKATDYYFAFRRIKNFACVEVKSSANKILVYVKVDPGSVEMRDGLRDVRKIGHFGTGDLEITLQDSNEFEHAKPLMLRSYLES